MSSLQLTSKAALIGCNETLPYRRIIESAVVIIDLSGYTSVTRSLIEQANQPNASEYVGRLVKHFFDPIFELIEAFGGDVVKYCGDAVICLFRDCKDAVHCCIEATSFVRDNPLLDFSNKLIHLAMHSVVHYGSVDLIYLGDLQYLKRAEFVCHGKTYIQACSLLDFASEDEILVTNEAWQDIELPCTKYEQYRIVSFKHSLSTPPPRNQYYNTPLPIAEKLTPFIDRAAQLRSNNLSSEIRYTSVAFIKLVSVNKQNEYELDYAALHEFFIAAVEICDDKAVIRQLAIDDKGISLLFLSGMPPAISENPCLAAACIALKLLSIITKLRLPFEASCGLATGRLFSGFIGTATRKEHAILGGAINLAARFMSNAPSGAIWCDSKSFELIANASALVQTRALTPKTLKGWKEPVTTYSVEQPTRVNGQLKEILNGKAKSIHSIEVANLNPLNDVHPFEFSFQSNTLFSPMNNAFVQIDFHNDESDRSWKDHLDIWLKLDKENQVSWSRPIVIEGPSGAGKTTTATRIASYLPQNIVLWMVQSFEIEQATPFSCTRQILEKMMALFEATDLTHICDLLPISQQQTKTIVSYLEIFIQSKGTSLNTAGSILHTNRDGRGIS